MKIIKKNLSLILLTVFVSVVSTAQTLPLPAACKFKLGDNAEWSSPAFNDADWSTKQLGSSWAAKDMNENVYAWYRIKIIIPSTMKELVQKEKQLKLYLGKIDDVDQTFFNGKLIGQTGSFPPNYKSEWQKERLYIIPETEVQWDKENIIAVRLFSPDIGGVGMYEGPYKVGPVQWPDFISVKQTISETANNGFITKLKFINKRDAGFDGTILYKLLDKNKNLVFSETKQVHIQGVNGAEQEVVFSNYQPVEENIFTVSYQIAENGSPASLKNEQLYLANKNIEIKVSTEPAPVITNNIKDAFSPILFQDQQQQGYLGKRMIQNLEERLLKVDEDGLMGSYLQRPGIHPWAGEHVGKYLEAACNVWKSTHNSKLKMQMDRMMYELIHAQLSDGYLGTYTPDEYWTSWDVWSHKYNLYGLLAYYTTTGYQPALDACKKIGDLLCTTFGAKAGQRDIILAGTHIGMAATSVLDPVVELYRYTGEKKYLDFCYYILDAWEQHNGPKVISALLSTGKVTTVGNGKAYEMLSNFVGLAKLYRVTGDEKLLKPVLIAWNDIIKNRLYISGTTSSFEYFQDDGMLPAEEKDHIGEGCVTVTWLQLNQNLLAITGDMKYAEQIEKTIYNHLLAAENPQNGCVSYYTPLMGKKPFTCYITCCQSSVPRGIAMIPYFTFGDIKNIPTLQMYEPALYKKNITIANKEIIDLSLQVESSFPENGDVIVTVNASRAAAFPIALRVPSWSNYFKASVGGKVYTGIPGQNLLINRSWRPGEKIKISFRMPVKVLAGGKNYKGQIAFQRGPQVLAYDDAINKNSGINATQVFTMTAIETKSVSGVLPDDWIGKQVYSISVTNKSKIKKQLTLVPYADASQTGGMIKVWLPLNIKK